MYLDYLFVMMLEDTLRSTCVFLRYFEVVRFQNKMFFRCVDHFRGQSKPLAAALF